MDCLVDAEPVCFCAMSGDPDVVLFWFEQLAQEIDIAPPVIEEPPLWKLDYDPPLSVVIREIAEKLHPGTDVTAWLYTQQELLDYTAQRDATTEVQAS